MQTLSDIDIALHNARAVERLIFVSQLITLPSVFDCTPRNENVLRSGRIAPRGRVFGT